MSSEVEICNIGLSKVGNYQIVSLDDTAKAGVLCKLLYPTARDELLQRFPWTFANRVKALAKSSVTPIRYTAQFILPTDYINNINAGATTDYKIAYSEIDGTVIMSNTDTLTIEYTGRVVDPDLYDPLFKDALACLIAYKVAYSLTGRRNIEETKGKEYEIAYARATINEAYEDGTSDTEDDPWVTVMHDG